MKKRYKCEIKFYYDSTCSNPVELFLTMKEISFMSHLSGYLEEVCDCYFALTILEDE